MNRQGELEIPQDMAALIQKILGIETNFQKSPADEKFIDIYKYLSNTNNQQPVQSGNESNTQNNSVRGSNSLGTLSKDDQKVKKDYNIIDTNKAKTYYQDNDRFIPINAIVIDPGHGGKDPGGLGINGIKEKEIVLSVSRYLYNLLKKNDKVKVIFTRKDDRYVTLKERTDLCSQLLKKNYNPVFVSIHGNISLNKNIDGIEVYSLSDKASDEEALSVEIIENAGFSKSDVRKTEQLYLIINDLLKDGIRRQSEELAGSISASVVNETSATLRGVKNANFYVLKYNSLPSVLVEIGFLSNPAESQKLMDKNYQKKIALGLYNGIIKFLQNYNDSRGYTR